MRVERNPADPRLPEALSIAAKASESYKYGCVDGYMTSSYEVN
jgi:hypothetical protein